MPSPDDLSEDENDRRFLENILPDYLNRCPLARGMDRPQGIIMGGQMGAGKSRVSGLLQSSTVPRAIPIDGDELREYHPLYQRLKRTDPDRAVSTSATDAGLWIEKLVGELSARRVHLLIEGTMRRFEPFRRTAEVLRTQGYAIRAAMLAVDGRVSWQATIQRAEEMAATGQGMRTVQKAAHDEAVSGVVDTCDRICASGLADRITVYARDGRLLIDMAAIQGRFPEPDAARSTILEERNRPWTEAEMTAHEARWVRIVDLMRVRNARPSEIDRVQEMRELDAAVLGYAIQRDGTGYSR